MAETLKRDLSPLSIVAVAFSTCNAWAAIGGTLALGIQNGGSVTLIYGTFIVTIVYLIIASSVAELVAQYPTAGGQYHWAFVLAPRKWKTQIGYLCACINLVGWIELVATAYIVPAQCICGIIRAWNSSYVIQRWHVFLLYQAFNMFSFAYNALALRRAPWTHDLGFALSVALFFVVTITCLARSKDKQSSTQVWAKFDNETGWTPAIAFLTGIVNINFGYAGLDGTVHMAEDCLNAATAIPMALLASPMMNFVTVFTFLVATLYCVSDFDQVLNTATQVPLYEMWIQATHSKTLGTVFLALLLPIFVFVGFAVLQTSSRLTWSFARDNALVGSSRLKRIHPRLETPVWALAFNTLWVAVIGCVYLGSSTAFNAIISPGIILEQTSIAIPAALLLWRHRDPALFPHKGRFRLGTFGWFANGVCVLWALYELAFYDLPVKLPVTAGNMNYSGPILGIIIVLIALNWVLHGRQRFKGPEIELWNEIRSGDTSLEKDLRRDSTCSSKTNPTMKD